MSDTDLCGEQHLILGARTQRSIHGASGSVEITFGHPTPSQLGPDVADGLHHLQPPFLSPQPLPRGGIGKWCTAHQVQGSGKCRIGGTGHSSGDEDLEMLPVGGDLVTEPQTPVIGVSQIGLARVVIAQPPSQPGQIGSSGGFGNQQAVGHLGGAGPGVGQDPRRVLQALASSLAGNLTTGTDQIDRAQQP